MARRAAICIGVNHAGTMLPLQAAVKGAQDFGAWAVSQGCDTKVLVDSDTTRVVLLDVFDAVQERLTNSYDQLIIYFSGHGILNAPGVEFWLLSRAPENANEAVNLYRSIEDARNCGIPHVVFISDACRSSVNGPPLSGVSGGTIFPNRGYNPQRGEIDVFYATRPGDPAWELPEPEATGNYRGVFTEILLDTVKLPEEELVEQVGGNPALNVIASRKLKPLLESMVPLHAAALDIRIRQTPEIQVGTALPKYFAAVDGGAIQRRAHGVPLAPSSPSPSLESALSAIRGVEVGPATPPEPRDVNLAEQLGLTADVAHLQQARGRAHFQTHTGLTLYGAQPLLTQAPGWNVDPPFPDGDAWHLRFNPAGGNRVSTSAVIHYRTDSDIRGTVVAVLPEFVGSVVIDASGRVISVNYVPSDNSLRFAAYQEREPEIEKMKAFAAVAARHGRFDVPTEEATAFAVRFRQEKEFDPVLGLYAAYAYAQAGRYRDVYSVFSYMRLDTVPVPFDVVMLAGRYDPTGAQTARYAPFLPMLTQGWALIAAGDPMFLPIHQILRPQLIPSLWTTLTMEGADEASRYLATESQQ